MKLYVAETTHYSLISRRMLSVHVPCDLIQVGSLVTLRIRDGSHAHLPNPVAPPAPRFWERRNAQNRDAIFHLVNDVDGRAVLHRVIAATVMILGNRPMLYQHVGLDDLDPALTGMVWELSGMLAGRGHILRVLDELAAVMDARPPGDEPLPDATDRIAFGHARLDELTETIDFCQEQVDVLASRVHDFVQQQAAVDRYHSALRNSDFLRDPGSGQVFAQSAAADLTERIAAVLDAYRDLTTDDHGQHGPL